MTPIQRAIAICGTQSELARRVKGKPATGFVYYWIRNGVTEEDAVAIEAAVLAAIGEDSAAAKRATEVGGPVTVEELRPDIEWSRDDAGTVVSYTKRVASVKPAEGEPSPRRTGAAPEGGDAAQADGVSVQPVSEAA